MAQPRAEHARRVVGYDRSPESRLAYRLLLGGTKHFGWCPEGAGRLSMTAAIRRVEDELGRTLALPPGSRVLDAGCGEGDAVGCSPGPVDSRRGRDDPCRALVRSAVFPVKHGSGVAKEGIRCESGAAPQR